MGEQTASVYTDYVNQGIKAGNFDPVTGKMKEVGKKAGAAAGKSAAKELEAEMDKVYDDLLGKKVSKDIASAMAYGGATSGDAALTLVNSEYEGKKADKYLRSTSMGLPGLDEYSQKTWLEYHGQRTDTMTAFFDSGGKQISESFKGFTDVERDAAYEAFTKGVQPGIRDSAKYFKSHSSEFSDTVASIWEDGAISGTEKLTAESLLKSLEMLEIKYPIEFEAANLGEVKTQLDAIAKDGLDVRVNLDKEELAVGIAEYINESFALHTKMLAAGQPPMAANEASYFNLMQKYQGQGDDETVKQLADIDTIIAEGNYQDSNSAAVLEEKLNYVVKAHPELVQQTAFQQRIATANNDLVSQYGISTGHLLQIKTSAESTKTASESTKTNTERTANGIYEIKAILSSGGFGSRIYNTYNSPSTQSNADSGRWASSAAWASDYGMGNSWGTAVKGATLNKSKLQNILASATYQEGGVTSREGAAWLHANEIVIPSGALPCAVSSQYQLLENPALFKQTGGIYPTAQGPNYQQLTVNVDALNNALPAATTNVGTLSKSFTWVSDLFFDKDLYDRLTISAPVSGFQSSSKRGQVPVAISEAAKAGMGFRNPFTDETADQHFGMSTRIFAAQMAAQGKSQVMPSGTHEVPDWAVKASGGIITTQSQGVLNQMVVERDTLEAVNTVKVRYNDLVGTELRNTLMMSDAALGASAASGQYCEAMSQQGIMIEEQARLAEKNGMFLKGYIGPSKDYEAAKAYFASETVPVIKDNTRSLDYFGDRVTSLDGTIQKNTDVQQNLLGATKQTSDILASGTNVKALSWNLTEFDAYIQSAESGLNSCVESMSDFAIMQEGVLRDELFKPSYIGKHDEEGNYVGPNYFDTFADNASFLEEAYRRGMIQKGGKSYNQENAQADEQLAKIGETSYQSQQLAKQNQQTAKENEKNTADVAKTSAKTYDVMGRQYALSQQTFDMNNQAMSNLISGGGGSGGWGSLYGSTSGSFWGGTSINGMGGWVGTGSSMSGWGAQASAGKTGGFGGSSGWGSVQWAEGGITDQPVFGVFGEAGREAFVPISDRAAGLRILPQVMRELGVRQFAQGGFSGRQSMSTAISPSSINLGGITINNPPANMNAKQLAKEITAQVEKKFYQARKRG
jgi:hypothetical protein